MKKLLAISAILFCMFCIAMVSGAEQATVTEEKKDVTTSSITYKEDIKIFGIAFAAAFTMGVTALSAGYAIAHAGSAALGAMAEKPEVGTWGVIIVALAEGIALYGLVIAFMLVGKI